jgi:hypothetical protein
MSCLQRCRKRRKISRDATGTQWRTLYDPLIRHVATFLDYKDAFAMRRLAKSWTRSLDDAYQQQFLSRRAAINLSYALFERPRGCDVKHLYMPMLKDDTKKDMWKDVKLTNNGGVVTTTNLALTWSTTAVDDSFWHNLLRTHEAAMTNFALEKLPCVIDVDLGPRSTCVMCVHPIIVPANLQLTQSQHVAVERLVTRTLQSWRATYDNLVQWRFRGLGRLMLCTIKRVKSEQAWKTCHLKSATFITSDTTLEAAVLTAAALWVPSDSFPLPARLLGAAGAAAL